METLVLQHSQVAVGLFPSGKLLLVPYFPFRYNSKVFALAPNPLQDHLKHFFPR